MLHDVRVRRAGLYLLDCIYWIQSCTRIMTETRRQNESTSCKKQPAQKFQMIRLTTGELPVWESRMLVQTSESETQSSDQHSQPSYI